MKIKTISAKTKEELDTRVNTFEEDHNVKATHTHIVFNGISYDYFAVAFFIPSKEQPIEKQIPSKNVISSEVMKKIINPQQAFKDKVIKETDDEVAKVWGIKKWTVYDVTT